MNYLGVHDSIRWCDTQAESPATQGDSKPFGHGPDVVSFVLRSSCLVFARSAGGARASTGGTSRKSVVALTPTVL